MEEALLRRLPEQHHKRNDIKDSLKKLWAGYSGEKNVDYQLGFLPEKDFYLFHNLRLSVGDRAFQMDSLVLTGTLIILVECKNYVGTLVFNHNPRQFIRIYEGKEEGFPYPIAQVNRQAELLQQWMFNHKIKPFPVETLVTISKPSTIIKFSESSQFQCVLHAEHLPQRIKELQSLYAQKYEKQSHSNLQRFSKIILQQHTPDIPNILEVYNIQKDEVLKGVLCPICKLGPLSRVRSSWLCQNCNSSHRSAHKQALHDYLFLHHSINNRECREFLHLESPSTSKRLLKNMSLPWKGSTKSRTYHLHICFNTKR